MAGSGARIGARARALAAPQGAAGLLAGFCSGTIGTLAVLAVGRAALLAAGIAVVVAWRLRSGAWVVCMAACGSALCLSTVSAGLRTRPPADARVDRVVEGVLIAAPQTAGEALRLDLATASGRVRLSWYGGPSSVEPGSRWRLCVRLRAPRALINPGGYDASAAALAMRLGAVGYVRDCPDNVQLDDPRGIPAIRGALAQELATRRNGSLLRALVVGDDGAVSRQTRHWLRVTGTSHLFVVSGLHVSLVAGGALIVARMLARLLLPATLARAAAATCGLLGAGGYVLLAGAGLPAQRALVMTAVGVMAHLAGRRVLALNSWLVAMAAVLALDPLAPLGMGFWLSFGVVGALILSARASRGWWHSLVFTQWFAFLAAAPVLLAAGGGLPVLAPLVNALMIPLVASLVVPVALGGTLAWLCAAPQLAGVLWNVADGALSVAMLVLRHAAASGAVIDLPLRSGLSITLASVAALAWLLPTGRQRRLWAAALALTAALPGPPQMDDSGFRIWALDVGQGLALVVETRAHTLLYDTGPGSADGSVLASQILPTLGRLGRWPDRVVVSHGDADHAGGYLDAPTAAVLLGIPTLSGEPARLGTGTAQRCRRGQAWHWDGVRFTVLHGGSGASGNDRSCVLWITDGRYHALLPGDIGAGAEMLVVRRLAARRVFLDLLVAPHHGSSTSSSPALIARLRGADVVISAGHLSRFGHPHPAVLERYRRAGARVWNTADNGALMWSAGKIRRRLRCDARLWRAPCR